MTLTIVFVFIICWSPYIIFDLLQVFGQIPHSQTNIAIATFIQSLAPLNSAANPLIYCLFSSQVFRTFRWAEQTAYSILPCLKPDLTLSLSLSRSHPAVFRPSSGSPAVASRIATIRSRIAATLWVDACTTAAIRCAHWPHRWRCRVAPPTRRTRVSSSASGPTKSSQFRPCRRYDSWRTQPASARHLRYTVPRRSAMRSFSRCSKMRFTVNDNDDDNGSYSPHEA